MGADRREASQASTSLKSHTTHRGESAKRRGNSPRCSISYIVLSASGTISRNCWRRMVRLIKVSVLDRMPDLRHIACLDD